MLEREIHRHFWPKDEREFHPSLCREILLREATDPGMQVANAGGWHSRPDLLLWEHPSIEALKERIILASDELVGDPIQMHAWANVMRNGAYQLAHRHGDATWSGVYYLDGDEGSGGEITFARRLDSHRIQPICGLMLIFPGHLLHSVAVYTGTAPRISLAFNFV